MRAVLALVLSLLIAATSGAMAVARGQAPAVGGVILCSGYGPVMVPLDAEGRPTGPAHFCPDLVLSHFAATPAVSVEALPPARRLVAVLGLVTPAGLPGRPVPAPAARGPPRAA